MGKASLSNTNTVTELYQSRYQYCGQTPAFDGNKKGTTFVVPFLLAKIAVIDTKLSDQCFSFGRTTVTAVPLFSSL